MLVNLSFCHSYEQSGPETTYVQKNKNRLRKSYLYIHVHTHTYICVYAYNNNNQRKGSYQLEEKGRGGV